MRKIYSPMSYIWLVAIILISSGLQAMAAGQSRLALQDEDAHYAFLLDDKAENLINANENHSQKALVSVQTEAPAKRIKPINFNSFFGPYLLNPAHSTNDFAFVSEAEEQLTQSKLKTFDYGYVLEGEDEVKLRYSGLTYKDNVIMADSSPERHALYVAKFKNQALQGEGLQISYKLAECQDAQPGEDIICDYSELPFQEGLSSFFNAISLEAASASADFSVDQKIKFKKVKRKLRKKLNNKIAGVDWKYEIDDEEKGLYSSAILRITSVTHNPGSYSTFKYYLFAEDQPFSYTSELEGIMIDNTLIFVDHITLGINSTVAISLNKKLTRGEGYSAIAISVTNSCSTLSSEGALIVSCPSFDDPRDKYSYLAKSKLTKVGKI